MCSCCCGGFCWSTFPVFVPSHVGSHLFGETALSSLAGRSRRFQHVLNVIRLHLVYSADCCWLELSDFHNSQVSCLCADVV